MMNDNNSIISPFNGGEITGNGGGGNDSNKGDNNKGNNNSKVDVVKTETPAKGLIDNNLNGDIREQSTRDKAMVDTKEYNFEGITLTENPKMSFFNADVRYATPSDGTKMAKKFNGVPSGLSNVPPSFYNSVQYPHRMEMRKQMQGIEVPNAWNK